MGLSLLALLVFCPSCQWLQNEFFYLDTARPAPAPDAEVPRSW